MLLLSLSNPLGIFAQTKEYVYDNDGRPIYAKNEIIIKFKAELLNKSVINTPEKQTGFLAEFVEPQVLMLLSNSEYFDASINVEKIFKRMRTTDVISTSRLGKAVKIPKFWATLLIHWEERRGISFLDAVDKLNKMKPYIEFAEPNYTVHLNHVPNDTHYGLVQRELHKTANGTDEGHINAECAWDLTTGQNTVKVGVYDTGIEWNHEDFLDNYTGALHSAPFANSRIKGGWDWTKNISPSVDNHHDEYGHGTKMAGIIGAASNNLTGIAGVAGGNDGIDKGVQLFSMKVIDAQGVGLESATVDAIVEGATYTPTFGYGLHILNCSFSYFAQGEDDGLKNPLAFEEAFKFAFENEVVIPSAAGNDDKKVVLQWPADYSDDWVLKVGGSNINGKLDDGSTIGGDMDIVAPFRGFTLDNEDRTEYLSARGTSVSTAFVSGVSALMLSYKPTLAPEDIEKLLEKSAVDIVNPQAVGYDTDTGFGKIDACAVLKSIKKPKFDVIHYNAKVNTGIKTSDVVTIVLPRNIGKLNAGINYTAFLYKVKINVDITQPSGRKVLDVWGRNATSNTLNSSWWPHHKGLKILSFNQTTAVVEASFLNVWDTNSLDEWIPDTYPLNLNPDNKIEISVYTEDQNSTGVINKSINDTYARVVPNPNEGNFKVLFMLEKDTNLGIQVVDLNGKVVYTIPKIFQLEGHKEIDLDLKHLPKGFYICNLLTDENIVSKKIIIQ